MKQIAYIFVAVFMLTACAKTTYIPFYKSQINLTKDNRTNSVEDSTRKVTIESPDKKWMVTVIHDEVDKSIDMYKLGVRILFKNNSDEDLFVGDMLQGLSYYHIPARSNITIPFKNPDNIQFRIANAYPFDKEQKPLEVAYVSVSALSFVVKKSLVFENDEYWAFVTYNPKYSVLDPNYYKKFYVVINKDTYERKMMDSEEFAMFKKKNKK